MWLSCSNCLPEERHHARLASAARRAAPAFTADPRDLAAAALRASLARKGRCARGTAELGLGHAAKAGVCRFSGRIALDVPSGSSTIHRPVSPSNSRQIADKLLRCAACCKPSILTAQPGIKLGRLPGGIDVDDAVDDGAGSALIAGASPGKPLRNSVARLGKASSKAPQRGWLSSASVLFMLDAGRASKRRDLPASAGTV